jgi:hypothetical protein
MSPAERMFLLKHVREGALKVDMTELAAKLTPSEARYLERS